MHVSRCGTVIANDRGQAVVEIQKTRCEQCSGTCAKFRFAKTLTLTSDIAVGKSVEVRVSSAYFSVGVALVFAPAVLGMIFALAISPVAESALAGFLFGLLASYLVFRFSNFVQHLQPTVSEFVAK